MEQVVCKNIQWEKIDVWCCGAFFPSGNIKQHQNEAHSDEQSYVCGMCQKSFSRQSAARIHERIHKSQFACDFCKKGFRQKSFLKKHKKICQLSLKNGLKLKKSSVTKDKQLKEQENNYPKERKGKITKKKICNICGTSILARNMSQHVKHVHTMKDVKNFSCEYCGKSFKLNQDLTRHAAIHTGQKNFTCLYCDKKFIRKSRAKDCENKHNGIFRLSCNLCEYKTNSKSSLNCHMNSHFHIKPYSCPVCKLKSGTKSDLRRHVRTQHEADVSIISRLEALYPQMYDASESNEGLRNDPLFQNMVLVKRSTRKSKWKDKETVKYPTIVRNNDNNSATKKRKLFSPKSQKSELFPEVDESGANENRKHSKVSLRRISDDFGFPSLTSYEHSVTEANQTI